MNILPGAATVNLLEHLRRKTTGKGPLFAGTQEHYSDIGAAQIFMNYYYTLVVMHEGEALLTVGTNKYQLAAHSLVAIGPGVSCIWEAAENARFDILFFFEDIFQHAFDNAFIYGLDFFCPDAENHVRLEGPHYNDVAALWQTIRQFYHKPEILPGLLHALLTLLQQLFQGQHKRMLGPKESLLAGFRFLISRNFTRHKEVSFYAKELHISPKYLSEVLQAQTGKSAKKWIEHHLAIEAKTMLSYKRKSIKEVAYELGFEDTSHFTKAFKKWEGITPNIFQKQYA